MAAISTVEPISAYWVQFALISAYAVAAALLGIAGVAGRLWAKHGLRVLAIIGAAYFLGAGGLALCYGVWIAAEREHLLPIGAGALVAASALLPGLLFVRAARNLEALGNDASVQTPINRDSGVNGA